MKLNLHVDAALQETASRLATYLNFELSEAGIPVYAFCGDRIGVALKDGVGTIYYKNKHHFFRELGVFVENAGKKRCI